MNKRVTRPLVVSQPAHSFNESINSCKVTFVNLGMDTPGRVITLSVSKNSKSWSTLTRLKKGETIVLSYIWTTGSHIKVITDPTILQEFSPCLV